VWIGWVGLGEGRVCCVVLCCVVVLCGAVSWFSVVWVDIVWGVGQGVEWGGLGLGGL
jgi:hypothetical protein